MTPQDALYLVAEIKKIDYRKRITKLAKSDWDFTNSIEWWAKQGRDLTTKQSYRLQEIYRRAAGHYKKVYSRIVSILLFCCVLQGCGCQPCPAQELTASYYSVESLKKEGTWRYSHGRMANGQHFNNFSFTCASCDYSLGTWLLVTSKVNGKSVKIKVTDRTNKRYKGKRVDLSISAMRKIDVSLTGLIPCRVEVIQ